MRYSFQEMRTALADANKFLSNGGYDIKLAIHTAYSSTSIQMKNQVTGEITMLLFYCSHDEAYLWLEGFITALMIPNASNDDVADEGQKSRLGFIKFIKKWL